MGSRESAKRQKVKKGKQSSVNELSQETKGRGKTLVKIHGCESQFPHYLPFCLQ